MAHLYDNDSDDDDFDTYGGAGFDQGVAQPNFSAQPSFGMPSNFGGSAFGGGLGGPAFGGAASYGGMGGMGSDPLSGGIGFGQASKFGGMGGGGAFGGPSSMGGMAGSDALGTDYVDLSNIKAIDAKQHKPNKFATSSKSSLKKPGKKAGPRGVSFGDVDTFHFDKESQLTASDRKSKSEENDNDEDDSDDDDDEDEIENNALANTLSETSAKEKKLKGKKTKEEDSSKPGAIAQMLKKMSNIEESITESGSMGLKKSLESDDSASKQLAKMARNNKSDFDNKKQRSPTGLSDSGEYYHHKSQDLDSKKLSSEYDSAELSRNFNIEESEDTNKFKHISEKSKKSVDDDTEYDDDFDASSNLHESSSMSKAKRSHDKDDDIEEIRKRNMQYKSNLDAFKRDSKSQEEHEDEISKRLDSYRARDEIQEESASESDKSSPAKAASRQSNEKAATKGLHSYTDGAVSKSLELENQKFTQEKFDAELQAKKFEMDAQVNRMEALNAVESNKILKERLVGYVQDNNTYRIEIEALKRQVDIADSNSSSKEQELRQVIEEYEGNLKLEREKHAHTNIRQENREINELKREVRLVKAAHEQEGQAKFEEIDYLTKRCEKLESENVSLRVGNKAVRDAESKAKKYEEEVHSLRMRLREQQKSKDSSAPAGSNYNNWTKDQLVREVISIDRAIERFTKENEGLMHDNKKQSAEIQELNALLYKESQKLQDYRHKIVKETGSVMIVQDDKDLHAKVLNDLGIDHAITQKEFSDLKEKLFNSEKRLAEKEQDFSV